MLSSALRPRVYSHSGSGIYSMRNRGMMDGGLAAEGKLILEQGAVGRKM